MKNIVLILIFSFFIVGCGTKEKVVEIQFPPNYKQNEITESLDTEIENKEEIIEGLDSEALIKEDENLLNPNELNNIALVYPSMIVGKYAKSTMSTIIGFYSFKGLNYHVKVFDSIRENSEVIQKAFSEIKEQGFKKVIALYSPNALSLISNIDTEGLEIYLPLIEKNNNLNQRENFIYGAISYDKQIEKLYNYSNTDNVMFYQESYLGKKLKEKYESLVSDIKIIKAIKNQRNYYKGIVKDYRVNNSSLFLNTNIIKTSILLSQITAHSIKPKIVLSTQQNYNPKILSLTQEKDRTNFIVANSIDNIDDKLEDEISNAGGDVKYNWVDYSTLVGVNYLFDKNETGLITTRIENNQVIYEPRLFKVTDYGFSEIK